MIHFEPDPYPSKRDGWKLSRIELLERDRSELADLIQEAATHDDNNMVHSLALSIVAITSEIERLS